MKTKLLNSFGIAVIFIGCVAIGFYTASVGLRFIAFGAFFMAFLATLAEYNHIKENETS